MTTRTAAEMLAIGMLSMLAIDIAFRRFVRSKFVKKIRQEYNESENWIPPRRFPPR